MHAALSLSSETLSANELNLGSTSFGDDYSFMMMTRSTFVSSLSFPYYLATGSPINLSYAQCASMQAREHEAIGTKPG